jgi:hypothetical protein
MRFPFFPIPAEGETIYSGLCRCAERSGLPKGHIVSELTCQKNINSLFGALPSYLRRLASSLPIGHPWTNLERTIRLHTAMPYYTYFDSPMRRNEAVQLLLDNDFSHAVGMALGLTQYRCGMGPKHPRFCIECKREDEAALGFSYFRREHQLPAVVVCWKHGCVLSHGCRTCGPYPVPRRGLSMPGLCHCAGKQSPLPVIEDLPGDPAILKWLACESAYMLSADGTRCPSVRAELRRQALNFGLCRGSQPVYADIATALEQRFGVNILDWLGYSPWTDGRPSAWIRGLLHNYEEKRKPTIVFLLFVGIVKKSVAIFEASSSISEDTSLSGKTVGFADWRADLRRLLANHSFRLRTVAKRVGAPRCIVAAEAREQCIRVPLPIATFAKLGREKIERIRSDLKVGMTKSEVQKKHRVTERTIQWIELDEPGIHDLWKRAVAQRIRDEYRQRVVDLNAADANPSRSALAKISRGTHRYMLMHDTQWFDETMPTPEQLSKATHPELPLWDLQACGDGTESLVTTEIGRVPLEWTTNLQHLLTTHSFNIAATASQIGVKQGKVIAEALKQSIRVPLSSQLAMKLGREKLESIRSELCAGVAKEQVARMHGVGVPTIRLIELDTPGISDVRKSALARKLRDAHRQRVLDLIASDADTSRSTLLKRAPGTQQYLLALDREWLEKTLPQRPRGRGSIPRGKRFDRGKFDSELAAKLSQIISKLRSTSHRPIRISKHCVLRRAECEGKYCQFSAELPKTQAVLNENVETMADYRVRRIKWAIAEMARTGQSLVGENLRRMAGLSTTLLKDYRPVVLQMARQLGVRVAPHSSFATST